MKIKFIDFYPTFDIYDNFFVRVLSEKYHIQVLDIVADEVPDFIFYSFWGYEHLKYDCLKIYWTGENDVPDFNECDYAISCHYLQFGDRHLRMPYYYGLKSFDDLLSNSSFGHYTSDMAHRPFASIVVSNMEWGDPFRTQVFEIINEYKSVASGGKWNNTIGGPVHDKNEFISRYKFNIACENSMVDGYTTEKIVEPFVAHTVPIYWGNKDIEKEFNPESYININDFDSLDSAVAYIKRVDSDNDLYMKILSAPKLLKTSEINWKKLFLNFVEYALEHPNRITKYGGIVQRNLDKKLYSEIIDNQCCKFILKCERKLRKIVGALNLWL
ncbi:MAG: glycosyltransferase [Bacteroides ovatus]|nr:glycosyltransferase [Bacteroides ovatus]